MFVSRYYGDTYFHITLVEVIGFLGMMAGGLLISTWGGFKRHTKTLLVGMVSFGLLATLMGLVKNFYMYLVLMAEEYGIIITSDDIRQAKTIGDLYSIVKSKQ